MKVKFIVALSIILVSRTSSSTVNDAFLANTKDVVLMEFSDGSLYRGQVGECVINIDLTSCMHGKGIYTFKAGSKYMGDFLNNKPNGKGLLDMLMGKPMRETFKTASLKAME